MTLAAERPSVRSAPRSAHPDLREWIELADQLGVLKRFEGADRECEIGAITEMVALQTHDKAAVLFDSIPGFPRGWRVMANSFTNQRLAEELLGLPYCERATDLTHAWRARSKTLQLIPTEEVADGPVFENVKRGAEIDLTAFPTPRWHEGDGGYYLGTACLVVTQDPDDGSINVGCYRMQTHDATRIGLYISPGKHGRVHRDKYFAQGRSTPVAAAFGMDPLLHVGASVGMPAATNEYEWVGGFRNAPVQVIPGPVTGLPIPAHAEIVIEGYVYPDQFIDEGPFGEWTGYYASDVRPETYVQTEGLYYRNDPIILGSPPMRPPADTYYVRTTLLHALMWDALDAASVPDVQDIAYLPAAGSGMLVISIKNRFAGHAKMAALVASQSRSGAYLGRYVVVVDDDIDINNVDEVLWAIWTRSDPEEADLIKHSWSTPLDPRITPENRARGYFGTSRMIIDATRPFAWRSQFPKVSLTSRDLQARMRERWGEEHFR
jgi:4-hydroxy-3-polyprenylbenzoate decarboxylase